MYLKCTEKVENNTWSANQSLGAWIQPRSSKREQSKVSYLFLECKFELSKGLEERKLQKNSAAKIVCFLSKQFTFLIHLHYLVLLSSNQIPPLYNTPNLKHKPEAISIPNPS